ncbi:MAG: flavodoxin domain-containing protein [Clostridia bacterium]
MKNVIIYGSNYGYTEDCAEKLAAQLEGETVLLNAKRQKIESVQEYDRVIIGSSVYMGQIHKEVKETCEKILLEVDGKKIGIFLCGGLPQNYELVLKVSFPEQMVDQAVATDFFGGEFRKDKMKLGHKLIIGMMKNATDKDGNSGIKAMPEHIDRFSARMNGR